MASVRAGKRQVLVIVDMQMGVVATADGRDQVIESIKTVVQAARAKKVPLIWVQHSDEELKIQSPEWELVPELGVEPGDYRIDKHHNSCFADTELEKILEETKATQIVLAGAATNWCIRATAYGALDRGYDLTLISDGHTTESIELDGGRRIEARDIITELNIVMSYVSYPGVKNRAMKAQDCSFA
jgi:nicotinamidase-related amidase